MSRNYVGGRSTGAGSTTLPLFSLYSPAGSGGRIREIGVFNTTTTALAVALRRLSTAGTQGAALDEGEYDTDDPVPAMTAFQTHSVAPTLVAGVIRQATIGAAQGAGVIWTFGDAGLVIKPGTGNGVGLLIATGTGQIVDFYIDWDE
jgi:hypothetical protein